MEIKSRCNLCDLNMDSLERIENPYELDGLEVTARLDQSVFWMFNHLKFIHKIQFMDIVKLVQFSTFFKSKGDNIWNDIGAGEIIHVNIPNRSLVN